MNMKPILQMLSAEDFLKMLNACKSARERFYLQLGRSDPDFEYHIDLPDSEGQQQQEKMNVWLADETKFSDTENLLEVSILVSKYKNLDGDLAVNLSDRNPVFYGLSPQGKSRCLEEEALYFYEPEHDYRSGAIVIRDGTRMAISQAKARQAGWQDLADRMAAKGIQ